jgi:hypothetical protein
MLAETAFSTKWDSRLEHPRGPPSRPRTETKQAVIARWEHSLVLAPLLVADYKFARTRPRTLDELGDFSSSGTRHRLLF